MQYRGDEPAILRTPEQVRLAIRALLDGEKRPLTRRYIETVLIFKRGAVPDMVTKSLADLVGGDKIYMTPIRDVGAENRSEYQVYSLTELSDEDREALARDITYSHWIFSDGELAEAGEQYVRALLKKSKLFQSVTPKGRLGLVPVPQHPNFKADILATLRDPVMKVVLEVKNDREHWYPTKGVFGTLMIKALALGALPVFVAAHISKPAMDDCKRMGILAFSFGFQIAPKNRGLNEPNARSVQRITGPTPYQFVNPNNPFKHGVPAWAQSQLVTLRNIDWASIRARWESNRDLATEYGEVLSRGVFRPGGRRFDVQAALKDYQRQLRCRYPTE